MSASMRRIFYMLKNPSVYCFQRYSIFGKTTPLTWCQFRLYLGQVRQYGNNSNEKTACTHDDITDEKIVEVSKSDVEQTSVLELNADHTSYHRAVGRSEEEQHGRVLMKPDQPMDPKLLRVAIIGTPNAGKSTLTNQLMRWKVSSVSPKVHTTRHNIKAVLTEDDTQIVFIDTPGLLHPKQRKKHNLDMTLVTDPERSLESTDLIAVLQDVSNTWTRNQLDPLVLQILHLYSNLPSILILNKVDLLNKKSMLLQITRSLTEGIVNGSTVGIHTKKTSKRRQHIDDFLKKYDQPIASRDEDFRSEDLHDGTEKSTLQNEDRICGKSDEFSVSELSGCEVTSGSSRDHSGTETFNDDYNKRHLISIDYKTKVKTDGSLQSGSDGNRVWTEYYEKRREVQFKIRDKNGWPNFSNVFMVSALTGDGVAELRDHLQSRAEHADWEYHSSLVTDQDPFQLACTYVWEKMLEHLPKEIPYYLYPEIVLWEVDHEGVLNILMNIPTKDRYYFFNLLGKKGETIGKIANEAKQELMNAFRCEMRFRLEAKLKSSS